MVEHGAHHARGAEGGDIPAGVPMQRLTPEAPEAAEGAPEPMVEVVEKTAGERRSPRRQRLLWRCLSAPPRSKTQSPSALRR
jgi:hypothetical protein